MQNLNSTPRPRLIFDAHLDLAMNALEWNRDFRRPISEIRDWERELTDRPDRGKGTVCLPEMRQGEVGICVATQIARYVKRSNRLPGWHSPEQAWAQTQGQLAWYRTMEEQGEMIQIRDLGGLQKQVKRWRHGESEPRPVAAEREKLPVGYILSLEGADSILTLGHLERAYGQGLRALGPAHYGPGTYAQGTDAQGGIGHNGRELLAEMDRLGIILDVTHLCDKSFWEALDSFSGPLWASHSNCRALVPHHRQFSDEQIRVLIQRGAVIGAALDAWMLVPGWVRGKSTPQAAGATLERVAEHMQHICELAGDSLHVGIGTDLDGAFGREQSPADLETISDLQKLSGLLAARGFTGAQIEQIFHGNFLRFLTEAWG